jgi:hypothetical protein
MSTTNPYRITMNRIRIMVGWVVMWIVNRGITKITTCVYIGWTGIISKPKMETWLIVPYIIRIKIDIGRMVYRWNVNYLSLNDEVAIFVFFNSFLIFLRIIFILLIRLFLIDITQLCITAG